ncbi:MAG: MCE family protein [Planctomycetes bacterium]|nr:MCE family protein [Planctomycetota bacterium]
MERPRQDLILGLVFFAALGTLVTATLFLKDLPFLRETEVRTIYFANAAGLRVGDNVFVLGNRMGEVEQVVYDPGAMDPQRRIIVTVRFDRPVRLTERAEVMIAEGSLLGGRQIQIDPGDGASVVPPTQPLLGTQRDSGLDSIAKLFGDPQLEADLKAFVAGLREMVQSVNRGEGTLGKLLTDGALYDALLGTAQSLRRSLVQIESGSGTVGRLIYDQPMGEDIAATVASFRSVADKADRGAGLVGRLLNDGELADVVAGIADDFAKVARDVREGRGTVGLLLQDEGFAADLRTTVANARDFSGRLSDPESGLVGELVAGRDTRDRFVSIVAGIDAIVDDARNGRGLLARLLTDEELGEQFSRVLNQVARAIEDARESAPIGTFFQVFSGSF